MDMLIAAELESQRLVKGLEVSNPEILVDITEYKVASDSLGDSMSSSDDSIKAQATINQEDADVVLGYKKEMADTIISLHIRAETKAIALQMPNLAKLFKHSFSYFYYAPKLIAIARAEAAEEVLSDNDKVLVNILPADLTNLSAKIAKFSGAIDTTKKFNHNKKAEGTDALDASVAAGKTSKQLMVKLIVDKYSVTNPKLAEKATLAGTTGTHVWRHITGKYSAIDADTLLPIVNPVFVETHTSKSHVTKTKTYLGDKNGVIEFETHRLGLYKVIAQVSGYISSAETPVTFVKGEANELVIKLKKAA